MHKQETEAALTRLGLPRGCLTLCRGNRRAFSLLISVPYHPCPNMHIYNTYIWKYAYQPSKLHGLVYVHVRFLKLPSGKHVVIQVRAVVSLQKNERTRLILYMPMFLNAKNKYIFLLSFIFCSCINISGHESQLMQYSKGQNVPSFCPKI